MARDVGKLRDFLFEELERLSNKELTGEALKEELERAKVISATAGRTIETAKAQTDRMKVLGDLGEYRDAFLEGEVNRQALEGRK